MSHVSLLEQSIDEDEADQPVVKQQRENLTQATTPSMVSKPRVTLHTAIDVEMASGLPPLFSFCLCSGFRYMIDLL